MMAGESARKDVAGSASRVLLLPVLVLTAAEGEEDGGTPPNRLTPVGGEERRGEKSVNELEAGEEAAEAAGGGGCWSDDGLSDGSLLVASVFT